MKASIQNKVPFGTSRMVEITHARCLAWKDALEVEFKDGLCFLEPHSTVRKVCGISAKAVPVKVRVDVETREGFFVHYDTGEIADVAWDFIRELPPKKSI